MPHVRRGHGGRVRARAAPAHECAPPALAVRCFAAAAANATAVRAPVATRPAAAAIATAATRE